jgi:DNA topoisomerase-1
MGRTDAHEGLTPPEVQPRKRKSSRKRSGKLVIVESPAKAKTVGRYLGKDYTVRASVGHVRDLLRSQLSVDVDNDFLPKYRVPNDKRPVVKELKALSKKAAEIYLATDPDREGEAIAWHLMEAAEMEPELTRRVVFHEITSSAVKEAFSRPREIDMSLVDAQQARRVLDRLVGYSLSPILWRKVRGRLSAGRVQSVALRMVVEREREVEAFDPQEYWTIGAELLPKGSKKSYQADLRRIDGEKPVLDQEDIVKPILVDMEQADFSVTRVKRGERRRNPSPPFITSTLQQDASRRLSFTAKKTMRVAQQLYEGIQLGETGNTGLITYMRTDSTNVSEVAQQQAREYVLDRFGEKYLPEEPPIYRTKAQRAQEAHEAIRPTSVMRDPKAMKDHLSRDQYRLYNLIWQRFVASQMSAAVYDTLSVDITGKTEAHTYLLRSAGSVIQFAGFLVVYKDDKKQEKDAGKANSNIPKNLEEGDAQTLVRLIPEQHFTQPPPRFSEASLVRALEENGIGRPSTYAPILGTLQQRGYVYRESRRLHPTETGLVVNDLLAQYFPNILDTDFTARMEAQLDRIADGDQAWVKPISDFYGPFAKQLDIADAEMPEVKMDPEPIGRKCPESDHELVIRWGRYGKFISCSGFPDCRYTEPWLEKIGVSCPLDGGDIVERKTRRGRTFYGCANYPECDFTSWKRPLAKPCPNCQGLLVIANKRDAQCTKCAERYDLESINQEAEAVA